MAKYKKETLDDIHKMKDMYKNTLEKQAQRHVITLEAAFNGEKAFLEDKIVMLEKGQINSEEWRATLEKECDRLNEALKQQINKSN